jgi:hypothetical protein
MQNALIRWIEGEGELGALSGAAGQRVRGELWSLLARKADILSLGDSSVRVEQAEELLRSLCYVVSLALEPMDTEAAAKVLAATPLMRLYRVGLDRLDRRVTRAKKAYDRALETALPFENLAYRDTLSSIGGFFAAYRPDLFAHDIPCMIDYPLFVEVSGLGASYIEAYLAQWTRENDFLRAFDPSRVVRLLNAHFADAREQVVNLFEPVAVNALALALLQKDPLTLHITPEDAACVKAIADDTGEEAFLTRLTGAADALHEATQSDALLLRAAARELSARVSLLPSAGMGGVFTDF